MTGDVPVTSPTAAEHTVLSVDGPVSACGVMVMTSERLGILIFSRTGSTPPRMLANGVVRSKPTGLLIV